jgi:hypothetical protein
MNWKRRLQSYTEQPDDLVWENIDAALRTGSHFIVASLGRLPDRQAVSIFLAVLAN